MGIPAEPPPSGLTPGGARWPTLCDVRRDARPAVRHPAAPRADGVRAQAVDLRYPCPVVPPAEGSLRRAAAVRQDPGDARRPFGRPAHPAQSEHRCVVAVRRPVHRAEDRSGERRARDPSAVHRHDRRGLQRRVVAGALARPVGRRVRRRVGAGSHPAAPARVGRSRRDLRHEPRLRPRGHPPSADDALHRRDGRRVRATRCDPRDASARLPAVCRRRDSAGRGEQRHPVDDARLPAGRNRADCALLPRGARAPHGGQAESHAAREGRRSRNPPRPPRLP